MSAPLPSAAPRKGRVARTIWWALPALAVAVIFGTSWYPRHKAGRARTPADAMPPFAAAIAGRPAGATQSRESGGGGRAPATSASAPAMSASASPAPASAAADTGALRVCADPNNLPFSDRQGRGFENRIAELIAADLHRRVEYRWWAQRRGFVRNTLAAGACDVVMGIAAGHELLLTSAPYYRSTYVFVQRSGAVPIRSFDDPRLRRLRVGIHVIGDNNALPPGMALARRGIIGNVRGYSIYGNYAQPSPPARLIEGVARGEVDVAVAWGPLAGYYAGRQKQPLTLTPVADAFASAGIPFTYAIALGVRRGDTARLRQLEAVVRRHAQEVRGILRSYGVPLVPDRSTLTASVGEGK